MMQGPEGSHGVSMPVFLTTTDPDFDASALLSMKREDAPDVDDTVAAIIADVRARGDAALIDLTERFDRLALTPTGSPSRRTRSTPRMRRGAGGRAGGAGVGRSHAFAPTTNARCPDDEAGPIRGGRDAGLALVAGLGGGALRARRACESYPSSVLMNAIPAQVAGVERLAICAPTPGVWRIRWFSRRAAVGRGRDLPHRRRAGDRRLAYGTETIAPVDKITGPGNAYVAAAKRRVFGKVGIDMIAGPSEILVIADGDNDPDWIALDLLSQAEHDESAQSILITDDAGFGRAVADAVDTRLRNAGTPRDRGASPGATSARSSRCAIWTRPPSCPTGSRPNTWSFASRTPKALFDRITHAGAIFLGAWTPEAIGDYVGGPNHVLPTARSARFSRAFP
jgi:histidinol dehydrogenase